jgi:predicted RNase H-like HicB family nuclease
MEIPVLIEPVASNGFRARGGEPFGLSAEGSTAEEALQNLRQLIQTQLVAGARIVPLEITPAQHPLGPFAGMFKDDPLFDEWQQAIADYRRAVDEDPDVP